MSGKFFFLRIRKDKRESAGVLNEVSDELTCGLRDSGSRLSFRDLCVFFRSEPFHAEETHRERVGGAKGT